jgi:hypothetical protein
LYIDPPLDDRYLRLLKCNEIIAPMNVAEIDQYRTRHLLDDDSFSKINNRPHQDVLRLITTALDPQIAPFEEGPTTSSSDDSNEVYATKLNPDLCNISFWNVIRSLNIGNIQMIANSRSVSHVNILQEYDSISATSSWILGTLNGHCTTEMFDNVEVDLCAYNSSDRSGSAVTWDVHLSSDAPLRPLNSNILRSKFAPLTSEYDSSWTRLSYDSYDSSTELLMEAITPVVATSNRQKRLETFVTVCSEKMICSDSCNTCENDECSIEHDVVIMRLNVTVAPGESTPFSPNAWYVVNEVICDDVSRLGDATRLTPDLLTPVVHPFAMDGQQWTCILP